MVGRSVATIAELCFVTQLTLMLREISRSAGSVTGTGVLSWWNPALNKGRGGWQLAGPGVFGPPKDRDAALAVPATRPQEVAA